MKSLEQTIMANLLCHEKYARKVLPYLQDDYVQLRSDRLLLQEIRELYTRYNRPPTKNQIEIALQRRTDVEGDDYKEAVDKLTTFGEKPEDEDWLLVETEKWCKEQALHNAIRASIAILGDETKPKGEIPKLVQDALAVGFSDSVGHDYIDDKDERLAFYHRNESRIPFNLRGLDMATRMGLRNKTLTVFLAGTNVGKSLTLVHCAANALLQGYNVLYITLEMAREKIAQRIDANLLQVPINEIETMLEQDFNAKFESMRKRLKGNGKLIVEEYPPGAVGVMRFKQLLAELKHKRKFVPQIIFIDYINLATSSRMKMGQNVSTYTYMKSVAEEFRALAVEMDVPVVTASQLNRKGFTSTDPDMDDVSESFGLPMTADLMYVVIANDMLTQQTPPKLLFKQVKNRDNDSTVNKTFVVAVDRSRMTLRDVDESGQITTDLTAPHELYKSVGNSRTATTTEMEAALDTTSPSAVMQDMVKGTRKNSSSFSNWQFGELPDEKS